MLKAGRDDPDSLADLLADDFMMYAPILGPLKKKEVTDAMPQKKPPCIPIAFKPWH